MGVTPFWSQPLAASRWIAALVTSMLVSRERVGGCRLLPAWAEEVCSMEVEDLQKVADGLDYPCYKLKKEPE